MHIFRFSDYLTAFDRQNYTDSRMIRYVSLEILDVDTPVAGLQSCHKMMYLREAAKKLFFSGHPLPP